MRSKRGEYKQKEKHIEKLSKFFKTLVNKEQKEQDGK